MKYLSEADRSRIVARQSADRVLRACSATLGAVALAALALGRIGVAIILGLAAWLAHAMRPSIDPDLLDCATATAEREAELDARGITHD